jgi:polyribonucleotide nucleotidyltransferase
VLDFNTGTTEGVTAFQIDTKIGGISFEIMKNALEQARVGRLFILAKMKECLSAPRGEMSPFAPRITIMHINPDKTREVIGPGGKIIKKITEETGCQIDIEDTGEIRIAAVNMEGSKRAEEIIRNITEDPDRPATRQVRASEPGAFVEITVPGRDGPLRVRDRLGPDREGRGRAERRRHGDGEGRGCRPGRQDPAVAPCVAPAAGRLRGSGRRQRGRGRP